VPKNGVFSFHDIQRGHAAQAAVLRMMGPGKGAPQTATPAAAEPKPE